MTLHSTDQRWCGRRRRPDATRGVPKVTLLLIVVQMLISLVPFAGVFIHSDEVLISPYKFCQILQNVSLHHSGQWSCDNVYESHLYELSQSQRPRPEGLSKPHFNSLRVALYLAVYVPGVIVGFALLGLYSVISDRDEPAIFGTVAFQFGAAFLTLAGLVGFLLVYQSYLSWQNITIWFYISLGVVIQLAITSALTHMSGKRLRSYWSYREVLKPVPA